MASCWGMWWNWSSAWVCCMFLKGKHEICQNPESSTAATCRAVKVALPGFVSWAEPADDRRTFVRMVGAGKRRRTSSLWGFLETNWCLPHLRWLIKQNGWKTRKGLDVWSVWFNSLWFAFDQFGHVVGTSQKLNHRNRRITSNSFCLGRNFKILFLNCGRRAQPL